MEIKVANKEDFGQLEPLMIEIEHHHVHLEPDVFTPVDFYDREHFDQLIDNEHERVLYIEIEGEVAGMLIAVERQFPPLPIFVGGKYIEIEELSVTKKFRRMGIGKALMNAAEAWAISRGLTLMQLSVWEKNKGAIRFYEEMDYEPKLIRYYKTLD